MQIKALKGVEDILPQSISLWNHIHEQAGRIFTRYGYEQLIIPIIEEARLFSRSIGEETDIVEKEMYTFIDRGNRNLALRPEATASVVRAYLEHNFNQHGLAKFFYHGPMFRGEKPQAGRNRQFYQIGVEALGSYRPHLDAEIIHMAVVFLESLGIKKTSILLNSVGTREDKKIYSQRLREFLLKSKEELCPNCKNRYEKNVLRILDCKDDNCRNILKSAPAIGESMCAESHNDFNTLKNSLQSLGVNFIEQNKLVRGLDYYTKTVFEILHADLGAQNTILAGGRYDNLIAELGGSPAGACGFACGVERICLAVKAEKVELKMNKQKKIFAIGLGEQCFEEIFKITHNLRKNGVSVHIGYGSQNIKKQMTMANKIDAEYTLILGENELSQQIIILKDMRKATQKFIPLAELTRELNQICDSNATNL